MCESKPHPYLVRIHMYEGVELLYGNIRTLHHIFGLSTAEINSIFLNVHLLQSELNKISVLLVAYQG